MRPILGLLLVCLAITGCGEPSIPADGKLRVAVTTAPQAWLVERIGGEHVRVELLLPPGASPATHQLSDAQVATLMQANLLLRTGVPFENGPWMRAVSKAGKPTIIDLRSDISLRAIEDHHHGDHDHHVHHHHHDDSDPHIWLAPQPLRQQVATIHAALSAAHPTHSATFDAGLQALNAELDALEDDLSAVLSPHRGRAFAVYHPAWGYLADAYGLEQVAIEAGGKEPSDAELSALHARFQADDITTLFVQSQIHGRSAEHIAQACDLKLVRLDPLAPDPIANLRSVATALDTAFQPTAAAP